MKGKRNPWGRLALITFREKDKAEPHDAAEAEKLRSQIDAGYAKTGARGPAKTARHRERALLVDRIGKDRLMTASLGKAFLKECVTALTAASLPPPPRGWSHNAVRLLIKELRTIRQTPRPFNDPTPPADVEDM